MESWDEQITAEPEPTFTLCNNISNPRQPRQLFLRYLKTVYGRPTASRVRHELDSLGVSDENFTAWKQQSFRRMMDALNNPPQSLLNRR